MSLFTRSPGERPMKNKNQRHKFEVVSGYDAELDGDDPRWGRVAVKCRVCGEERRVACSPYEMSLIGGCYRSGRNEPWQAEDLLVRDGGPLDQFVKYMPGDMVLTYNAGGNWQTVPKALLKPY